MRLPLKRKARRILSALPPVLCVLAGGGLGYLLHIAASASRCSGGLCRLTAGAWLPVTLMAAAGLLVWTTAFQSGREERLAGRTEKKE